MRLSYTRNTCIIIGKRVPKSIRIDSNLRHFKSVTNFYYCKKSKLQTSLDRKAGGALNDWRPLPQATAKRKLPCRYGVRRRGCTAGHSHKRNSTASCRATMRTELKPDVDVDTRRNSVSTVFNKKKKKRKKKQKEICKTVRKRPSLGGLV